MGLGILLLPLSALLEQIQVVCSSDSNNIFIRMPSGMKDLSIVIQTFHAHLIFLLFVTSANLQDKSQVDEIIEG